MHINRDLGGVIEARRSGARIRAKGARGAEGAERRNTATVFVVRSLENSTPGTIIETSQFNGI